MKILLVDDDQALVIIFETALQKEQFETVTASEGKKGLEEAINQKPDFILLDQVLPDMPGNDVLKQLKANEVTKNIPVAMLSNFGQNELVEDAINHGALDYILKYQVEPQDLVNKVKDLLKQTQQTTEASQPSQAPNTNQQQ